MLKSLNFFALIVFLVSGCQATTAKIGLITTQDLAEVNSKLPLCSSGSLVEEWSNCVGNIIAFNKRSKYIGEFVNGKKHGKGIYTSDKGSRYVGTWKNDQLNGFGTFQFWFGDKYTGEWKDDKFHGWGVWIKANKEKYVGGFKNGVKHGSGTETFTDGKVKDGLWANGQLVSEQDMILPLSGN